MVRSNGPLQGIPRLLNDAESSRMTTAICHFFGILLCCNTAVSDLSPLKGMPLTRLVCDWIRVRDFSVLKETPIGELKCDFVPQRDAEILRSIKTLKKTNHLPAAEFWRRLDAGESP